ncbi:MAG: efflux RND transporter periplasmic adaptor subunit [Acetobacteraceae bacterium]|nr:efflux RND transporter periplasmic adaptor subunit [Acetobacteraceae bacterium]
MSVIAGSEASESGRCRSRRRLAAAALLAAATLLPGIVRAQAPAQASAPANSPATPPAAPPGTPVRVASAKLAEVPVYLRNIGTVQAFQSVLIRARVDGMLDQVYFTEGQAVKVGDKLAQIDPRPYAAALAAVNAKRAADQAQLANAKLDLNRYTNLARSDFASRQQLDTQMAQVAQLTANLQGDEANVATAQLNLDYTTITSPIEGITGLRLVDVGNLIHATDAAGIVVITQVQPISVVFTLPQDALPDVRAAMSQGVLPVFAYAADDRTLLAKGQLLTTDNAIDQATGTIRLKATFANADRKLWPGQFVNVHLQIATLKDVVTIPSEGVQRGPNGLFAYVVQPNMTAAVQPIEIRQDDGTMAVVTKGLDEGAQVVVNGQSRLQNGTRVAVAEANKPNG